MKEPRYKETSEGSSQYNIVGYLRPELSVVNRMVTLSPATPMLTLKLSVTGLSDAKLSHIHITACLRHGKYASAEKGRT